MALDESGRRQIKRNSSLRQNQRKLHVGAKVEVMLLSLCNFPSIFVRKMKSWPVIIGIFEFECNGCCFVFWVPQYCLNVLV